MSADTFGNRETEDSSVQGLSREARGPLFFGCGEGARSNCGVVHDCGLDRQLNHRDPSTLQGLVGPSHSVDQLRWSTIRMKLEVTRSLVSRLRRPRSGRRLRRRLRMTSARSRLPTLTQIFPAAIHRFDQSDLLRTPPPLELLFSCKRNGNIRSLFEVDQPSQVVVGCMP